MADVYLPGVYIGLTDHLASFSQVVNDATQELRDQILSYREKLKEICKSGGCANILYKYYHVQMCEGRIKCLLLDNLPLSDQLVIKTMVQAEIPEPQPSTLPDPETREDFLKCKGPT